MNYMNLSLCHSLLLLSDLWPLTIESYFSKINLQQQRLCFIKHDPIIACRPFGLSNEGLCTNNVYCWFFLGNIVFVFWTDNTRSVRDNGSSAIIERSKCSNHNSIIFNNSNDNNGKYIGTNR